MTWDLHLTKTALLSDDGIYRYTLTRTLAGYGPPLLFGMLNPSKADHSVNDPTIVRCIGFANRENASWLGVVNPYGLRATNPRELRGYPDPIGPENDAAIYEMAQRVYSEGGLFIAAWGAHPMGVKRGAEMLELIRPLPVYCLGTTQAGAPRHPLYLKSTTELVRYYHPG